MSKVGLIKSGGAFAKSLLKSLSKTAAKKPTQVATKQAAEALKRADPALIHDIESAENLIFKSAKKTTGSKNEFVESWSGKIKAINTYDHGDLVGVTSFGKNGKPRSMQAVYYNTKNQPACLFTMPTNPKDPNMFYRVYDYAPNGSLQSIVTTTQISDKA